MKRIISVSIVLIILILGFIYYSKIISSPTPQINSLPTPSFQTVTLYYYSEKLDKDETDNILCSEKGLVGVERQISQSNLIINDTIQLLINGELSNDEKAQGITTEFPLTDFELINSDLQSGVLTLTFNDPALKTSGGACRVQILQHQIEATAKQFAEVSSVIIKPSDLFQP